MIEFYSLTFVHSRVILPHEVRDMKRISKAPDVRRQELLDTAMELFAQKGYEETSMGDIARAAGVAQGLCYRYFDSKQKLFQ